MAIDVQKSSAQDAAVHTVYAIPRVNLLPPEILAERSLRRTKVALGAVVLAVLGGVAGGFVLAAASADSAQEGLAAEQARTTTLSAEQAKYAEVPAVISQVEAAKAVQATAMSSDVLWAPYLNHIAASYPQDVWLRDLNVSVAAPGASVTSGVPATGAAATPSDTIGMITFNGTGRAHEGTAAWLDVMSATPGFANPLYSASTRNEVEKQVVVDFTTTVDITSDALSHRYEIKAS